VNPFVLRVQVDVAAYVMDVELLFSSAAFATVGKRARF
jgi:hypothetical protein